jgi:hypothetical protein
MLNRSVAGRTIAIIQAACIMLSTFILLSTWCPLQRPAWCQPPDRELPQTDASSSLGPQSGESLDRIIVRQGIAEGTRGSLWKPWKRSENFGRILHIDSKELLLELDTGQESSSSSSIGQIRIPADQIEAIHVAWRGEDTRGFVELFDRRRYREFIQALRTTDLSGIPQWQQLLLLGKVVQAVEAVQGPTAAAEPFLKMSEAAPDFLFASIPLCWTVSEVDPGFLEKCRQWVDSPDEAARLIGASWQLNRGQSQTAAAVLNRLKSSSRPAIAQLATAQLWRLVPPPDTMNQLSRWIEYRDRLLPPLALGPSVFLVDRLTRIGQVDLAVGQSLWIATMDPAEKESAIRALKIAGDLVAASGNREESSKIEKWRMELLGAGE